MAIPRFWEFIGPLLRELAAQPDGVSRARVMERVADAVGLTREARAELLPSGHHERYKHRRHWPVEHTSWTAALLLASAVGGTGCDDGGPRAPTIHDAGSDGSAISEDLVTDGGDADGGLGVSAATKALCDAWFEVAARCPDLDNVYCELPSKLDLLSDSDLVRSRERFLAHCAGRLALPGSGLSPGAVAQCSASIESGGCGAALSACGFAGTLAMGATCVLDEQCASGYCAWTLSGGLDPAHRTCGIRPAVGQACDPSRSDGGCGANAYCSWPEDACAARAAQGAYCDDEGPVCKTGLACDLWRTEQQCVPLGDEGTECSGSGQCVHGLVCPPLLDSVGGTRVPSTCQPPGEDGAPCWSDFGCGTRLGCIAAYVTTPGQCGEVTFADGGEACNESTRCKVGSCLMAGRCPRVLADGDPCGETTTYWGPLATREASWTCDLLSACTSGICQRIDHALTCDPYARPGIVRGAFPAFTPPPASGPPIAIECPTEQPTNGDACQLPMTTLGQTVLFPTCGYRGGNTRCSCAGPSGGPDPYLWVCETCPEAEPGAADTCSPSPLLGLCAYGDDRCRCEFDADANERRWACQACPAAMPSGDDCYVAGLVCDFGGVRCSCFETTPGAPHGWRCG